ncbi:hypothetical protein J4E90_009232 [Alternaria incomplexa]|uniref:uncharacterized protein n=1 Tax=Alternaria incomplexa TaxID=1187928 RepID=UPI0022201542|nr:uncharacterized protein J4E90_009232 [Alternaria incomplexa]KAI4907824.1 hypothetical protein J4E90_009232 [Alternaria incomplexa]
MTKDWELVQDEIKELSFVQKKPLEEVKELMERKHKFRASTRAYRMRLKEWGIMRHKPRRATKSRHKARLPSEQSSDGNAGNDNESSEFAEPISTDSTSREHCTKTGGWQVVASLPTLIADEAGTVAQPTFLGLLNQPQDLRPSFEETSSQDSRQASDIVLDMVGAVLDGDLQKLEKLIVDNVDHINHPIGLPFDEAGARFVGHPALSEMVILQHPNQTVFDIACGMPCGPIIWVLLAYGAKGSKHPLGTDLALHNAIKNGRTYTVQALLQPGRSEVNGLPGSSWTPLRQAVFWNVPDIVRILLNRGANVEDAGPSPEKPGVHTALQLCLLHRMKIYTDPAARKNCHTLLEMLLSAGANVHRKPPEHVAQSNFGMFIMALQNRPYWAAKLSSDELECLRLFVCKGASFPPFFGGYPCKSLCRDKFEHQALWHSTPTFARWLIDTFVPTPTNDGTSLLSEVLGCCPNAKRHPTDTLRDIEVLLGKGVDPNSAAHDALSPLRKCIADCPAVDIVPRLRMLVNGGADPECEDADGVQPYVRAAESFEEPLRTEVMSVLVAKISGRHVRRVNDASHTWAAGLFPISETQTYDQVMACTRQTGEFMLNMRNMVPEHVQSIFQRAYFTVISEYFLNTMTRVAKTKMLSSKEKDEIVWIVSMRDGVDLPKYSFDQKLVIALLDPQPLPSMMLERDDDVSPEDPMQCDTVDVAAASPASSATVTGTATVTAATDLQPHAPFQFNSNRGTTSDNTPSPPRSPQWLDDFFVASTTQIRWRDPCAPPKPGEAQKAFAAVLIHKCATCNDDRLLTKRELERHDTEHGHTGDCDIIGCKRRFCAEKRTKEHFGGCQDHLFSH